MRISARQRGLSAALLIVLFSACNSTPAAPAPAMTGSGAASPSETPAAAACPVTEPAWVKPPEDAAVQDPPGLGYYFVNEDSSMMMSAWWTGESEPYLRASEEGIKTGWFRPAGAALEITGRRIDGQAPPLHSEVPCCYPSRFQAAGLFFPTEGCWAVTAEAAGSELSFVVRVEP